MVDSSSVSVKEVSGVLTGPVCGAMRPVDEEDLGTGTGVEAGLEGCVGVGQVGVIVWNTSSRLSSSSSLGELEMLAMEETSELLWSPSSQVSTSHTSSH